MKSKRNNLIVIIIFEDQEIKYLEYYKEYKIEKRWIKLPKKLLKEIFQWNFS